MTAKTYRVTVTTRDGRRTHWTETSRARDGSGRICERVAARLAGLDLRRVEVDLIDPA